MLYEGDPERIEEEKFDYRRKLISYNTAPPGDVKASQVFIKPKAYINAPNKS